MKSINFTLLIIYCLLSFSSYGTTYYVSPSGNDANLGTKTTTPWKTIAKVNGKNFTGDTILFQGGSTFWGRIYLTNTDIGTSTKPVVLGSYGTGRATINSDTSYGILIYNAAGFKIKDLILTGVNRLTNVNSGIMIFSNLDSTRLNFIRIENVEIYGYGDAGITIGTWAQASGFNDVSITKCMVHDNARAGIETYNMGNNYHKTFTLRYNQTYNNSGIASQTVGNSGSGILLANVDGAVVEYCTSYNNGWLHNTPDGGPVGIWAHASKNVSFRYNESHHNKTGTNKDGGGFDFDGGCTNSTMEYNYSHDNYGGGFLLAQYTGASAMTNITIRYNISENDSRKGDQGSIHIWASSTSGGIQTVRIYNNTVFTKPSTNYTPKAFYIRSGPMSGIKLWNNVFQTTGGVPLVQVPYNTSACIFQGNSYWSSGSTFKIIWGSTIYTSLSTWRTGTGNKQEYLNGTARGLQTDAQFADTTTGVTFNDATKLTTLKRYKLKSTSTLINKGLNLKTLFAISIGSRDFWGNSIVDKSTFHIGAFQGTPISATLQSNLTDLITQQSNQANNTNLAFKSQGSDLKETKMQVSSNPGQSNMTLYFTSAQSGRVLIAMFNLQGQCVNYIFSGQINAGNEHQFEVGTTQLSNGIYLIKAQVGGEIITKKILISK